MPRRSKNAAKVVEEMVNWDVAKEMIARGARPPIVLAATNLSRDALRDLWEKMHNTRPPSGLLKFNSLSYIRRLRQAVHASFFFVCYVAVGQEEIYSTVDPQKVLKAHDLYRKLVGDKDKEEIDFSFAWFIARDIRSRILERKYCPTCQIDYLYSVDSKTLHGCPHCRSYKQYQQQVKNQQ